MEIAGSRPLSVAEKNGADTAGACSPLAEPPLNGSSHGRQIPSSPEVRASLTGEAQRLATNLPHALLTRNELEHCGRQLIESLALPASFLGFAMVLLGNALWKRRFLAVPFERRLLLLPRHLAHTCGSTQTVDDCDACQIAAYRARAERLGYSVLVAERSPAVLSRIVESNMDAILGVASLDDLEKAIDRVLFAGVPSFAVPMEANGRLRLMGGGAAIEEVLERYEPRGDGLTGYIPVMRAATRLFRDDFERLLPRVRSSTPELARSPLGLTEGIAFDWLANGGKRFRPFITLAAYAAASQSGSDAPQANGAISMAAGTAGFPDSVCRVAMAIEAFHKASLVHDDIQDDDLFRYGRETLHRSHGLGPAINVGDYLIGLGYRLVNSCRQELGAEIAADIVDNMSGAHLRLCDGQGAEMAWRDHPDWSLTSRDALRIYALKTSPAFEAALYAGLRMAGPVGEFADQVSQFCRQLGIGFQILNDLQDWSGDRDNKMVKGQDALALRPTVLLGLAMESASADQQVEIRGLFETSGDDAERLQCTAKLYSQLGAFEKAQELVMRARARSEAIARSTQPEPLKKLFEFLIETVLADAPPAA